MENYLYLLEFFVETITFSSNLPEYPLAHEVKITGEMGVLKMDVFTIHNIASGTEPQKEMNLNCGKSTLFSCSPDELYQKINLNPFTIHVFVNYKEVASAEMGWTKDFYTLVKKVPTSGIEGPVSMQDQFLLKEPNTDRIMGDIKTTVRMSLFGENIQTTFQMVGVGSGLQKKFLVKGARGDVTFECQQFGSGNSGEVLPMTTLFTDDSRLPPMTVDQIEDDPLSWMALFKTAMDSKFSIRPDEFNVTVSNMFEKKNASNLTFDIISLMEKPEENKFIDLRIKGGSHGFVFEFDPIGLTGGNQLDSSYSSTMEEVQLEEPPLTAEYINKMLCKNKDCPAAKKFKEFGIGPLAITKGLGAVYGEPTPHVTYGMSQTYGVFDDYGPYGLFSRPKRPSAPFLPKQESDWASSCWKPKRKRQTETQDSCNCSKEPYNACHCRPQKSPLRLSGGGFVDEGQSPLRLTGGGVLDYDDVKSPFHECKEIMDQFDEVLAKYKKALGPCGKTTCPFAPNVAKEACKKMCPGEVSAYSIDDITSSSPQPTPPPSPVTSKFKPNTACGSPKCVYAKYKSGLVDEDAETELQYLPSATSGKCGHPKCPSPVQLDLPPIHWECPDPLPKGRCKNPECPYLPKEIKCLNAVLAKGPCGNYNCPFSPPPPCDYPYCPFQNKECPYQPDQSDSNSMCDSPECPFAPKKNESCPFGPKPPCGDNPCVPPPCSYMNPYLAQMLATYALLTGNNVCYGDSNCPYMQAPKSNVCQSPKKKSTPATCSVKKKPSPCYIPEPVETTCGNPSCPFPKAESPKKRKNEESGELKEGDVEYRSDTRLSMDFTPCTPNSCKFQGGDYECEECCGSKPKSTKQNDGCDNPDCPFTPKTCYIKPPPPENDDLCHNPECPYTPPEPPTCPMVAPPCGFPFTCPYGIDPLQALLSYCMPITICPDGVCPYPNRDAFPICFGGPGCQFSPSPQPCVTEKEAPKDEVCDKAVCSQTGKGKTEGVTTAPVPEESQQIVENETEYTSDIRVDVDMAPCTAQTCKSTGGALVCKECTCDTDDVEYTSDTRLSVDLAPCTAKTCESKGGALICDVCPCSKPKAPAEAVKKKKEKETKGVAMKRIKKKIKSKSKYVYSIGDKYPGVQIGHKECVMPAFNVPSTMGWLWNIFTPCMQLKPRRGWRPGAIAKTIAARIRKHREAQGLQMLELKELRKGKKGYGTYTSGTSINVQPKPTLHIKKHDGCYWITMNPLKDPHTLVENESPYMDCTPLQFKIMKNKKDEENDEYKSCFCGDDQEGSSSSDSELEIEFTPPAGIIHPERFKKKRNVVHCDTQYMPEDFEKKTDDNKEKGKKGKGKKGKGKEKGKGKKGKK